MSYKSKKLSQLLFRRSSSHDAMNNKPARNQICYQYENQNLYENLDPGPTASVGRGYGKEEDSDDESTPLIPIAIPQLVENKRRDNSRPAFGRVVIFADKANKNQIQRARSCSPTAQSRNNMIDGRPQGILKTSKSSHSTFHYEPTTTTRIQTTEGTLNERMDTRNIGNFTGKSTLQRTKSNPAPSSLKRMDMNKSIPVRIPSPPKLENCPSVKLSRSNPLLNVSWNCPTLEKRKEIILNYFKNFSNRKDKHHETTEPIYEEIREKSKVFEGADDTDMDSLLKPKLSPKKVRLNLLPTYNVGENVYQLPVNRELNRSTSFSNAPQNNRVEYADFSPNSNRDGKDYYFANKQQATKNYDSASKNLDHVKISNQWIIPEIVIDDNNNNNIESNKANNNIRLGMANFAAQVAQQAKANLSKKIVVGGRSQSFSFGELSNNSACSLNNLDFDDVNINSDDLISKVDDIYLRLDKRGKKSGTPTTRLLKRNQSQNIENRSLRTRRESDDNAHINASTNIVSSLQSFLATKNFVSQVDLSLTKEKSKHCSIYANANIGLNSPSNSGSSDVDMNSDKDDKEVMSNGNNAELSAKSEDSETESGFSMDSTCEEVIIFAKEDTVTTNPVTSNNKKKPISASEDSCYSCTNSSNSSSSSSEEESESRRQQQQRFISTAAQQNPPCRPPRATSKAKPAKKITLSYASQSLDTQDTNVNSSSVVVEEKEQVSNNFITNVSVDKDQTEGDISRNQKEFINLTDFPHIDLQTRKKSILTISVIDSTQSTPTSYPVLIDEKEQEGSHIAENLSSTQSTTNPDEPSSHLGCLNWADWYRSLKKGTVHLDDSSVLVTHHTPKDKGKPRNDALSSSASAQKSGTDCYCCSATSFDLENFDSKLTIGSSGGRPCEKSSIIEKPQGKHCHFSEEDNVKQQSSTIKMSATSLMTPTASIQGDKLSPSSGLLIETQNLWDTSLSPTSPNSHSSSDPDLPASSSSSTTSDISETSVQLATIMTDAETRNQFIRQDSKYYDDADIDAEEDGGFESFQVLDADGERYEDEDDGNSNSDEGQFLGISESTASRQLTFSQLSQNIPEKELKQKASTVLDLINAEISDLHTRELELKKKNRTADGKGDYEGESEDFVEEGSSQADSDDYSDSAVDMVETFSRTSNSSGNVTPADSNGRDKSEERERSSGSPPRTGGSFNPAEVGDNKVVVVQDQIITSSSLMTAGSFTDEDEAPSSGTTSGKVGVKVRPIVEEEVKSIELSVEKETPIEREIRLVRERETEFRRQRIATTGTSADSDEQSFPTSPTNNKAAIVNHHEEASKKITTSGKASNVIANVKSIFGTDGISAGGSSGQKDLQYEMATARLKREMEENLMRERELFQEGRLKSLSAPEPAEVAASDEASNVTESESATPNNEDDADDAFQDGSDPEEKVDESQFTIGARRAVVRLPSEPVSSQLSAGPQPNFQTSSVAPHSAPAVNNMRFFAPAGFSPQSHHSLQRGSSFSSTQTQSLPFSKAQFTSIERMILKGSFAFNKNTITIEEPQRMQEEMRMNKIALMPDPLQIVHRVESIDETEEGGEVEQEEVKPRRKYVPAQDKIQKELQEQSKREKELSQLRAKWKSTPDLSKSDDKIEGEAIGVDRDVEGEGLTKPSALRRQMSSSTQKLTIIDDVTTTDVLRINKPTVRRRQSALINQWEEMIKQQQQKNNKN